MQVRKLNMPQAGTQGCDALCLGLTCRDRPEATPAQSCFLQMPYDSLTKT